MTKTLSLLAGVAVVAGAGAVSAGELLTLDQMDEVTAGYYSFNYTKNYYGDVDENVDSDLDLDGNAAEGSAEAHAVGDGSGKDETLAITATQAFAYESLGNPYYPGESYSSSVSIAAVDDGSERRSR